MTTAEKLSLNNFLNAYIRENPYATYSKQNDAKWLASYVIEPLKIEIFIQLHYYSKTGRHQFIWPAFCKHPESGDLQSLHPWSLIGLLIQDLSHRHPRAQTNHREFIQRFYNSCDNLEVILSNLSKEKIDTLFAKEVDFESSENGLLIGHPMHPVPKSREGFTKEEFKQYSPELGNEFQLHYFLADKSIIYTDSCLEMDANELINTHLLTESIQHNKAIIPFHPWQAKHIKQLPIIQKWISENKLIDLGQIGVAFNATSSVRTLYNRHCPFMLKLSLNVTITNSLRTQYGKELIRGLAAHQFWNSEIGCEIKYQYPAFTALTDPAFVCLKNDDQIIHESAALFRINPFTKNNNATSLASLCQDHPYENRNRLNALVSLVSAIKQCSKEEAASCWFSEYLKIAIEPVLWIYIHYGIAIEAHQQNIIIEIENGLPKASYYRDNQGYYITEQAFKQLSKRIDEKILMPFCNGTNKFITHHLIYYLICNNVFGIINALGVTGCISETKLIKQFADYVYSAKIAFQSNHLLFDQLLQTDYLPFKANLLTRFYALDELIAPLEQQSVYVDIENIIKQSLGNNYASILKNT